MKKLFLFLSVAAMIALGGCDDAQPTVRVRSGTAVSCDQLGHLSLVNVSSDGSVSHSSDITSQIQTCRVLEDGSIVLSNPIVPVQPVTTTLPMPASNPHQ